MTSQQKYRAMLKEMGWKTKDVSYITGLTEGSLRGATSASGKFPRHFLLALEVFERMSHVAMQNQPPNQKSLAGRMLLTGSSLNFFFPTSHMYVAFLLKMIVPVMTTNAIY